MWHLFNATNLKKIKTLQLSQDNQLGVLFVRSISLITLDSDR